MNRRFFVAALIIPIVLLFREALFLPDGETHLLFLDIGQGDSELIITPSGKTILIDGGPDLTTLEHLGTHLSFFDRSIDLLIITHPDLDHIASFPEVLLRYDVKQVLLPLAAYDNNGKARKILHLLKEKRIPVLRAVRGTTLGFDDGVALNVLWPTAEFQTDEINDLSVVFRLTYDNRSAFFTGDASVEVEHHILKNGDDVSADILKVGHHGSRTSTSDEFLHAVDPSIMVISAGRENRFGHPHAEVTERLTAHGGEIRETAREGTVELRLK